MQTDNLYLKIDELMKTEAKEGDSLTEDQKKIINSALSVIEKELADERTKNSRLIKLRPSNEELKRKIDAISYNTLNIRHLRIKLGIKLSFDQNGQNS